MHPAVTEKAASKNTSRETTMTTQAHQKESAMTPPTDESPKSSGPADGASWSFGDPDYTIHTRLPGADFDQVLGDVRVALAHEGFGILTEINMSATLKTKLNVDTPKYVILGACNPVLAFEALRVAPGVGALLPCNVVVAEDADGIFVGAIDPVALFSVVHRPDIESVSHQVRARLARLVQSLGH
jgi:uncharacterized protein (DUF302 family)